MTAVSVVVPYFEHQRRLDLLLTALELQTERDFDVVVADDGSRTPPDPGLRPYPVAVVRQEDRGIRPAAARNLGASASAGDLLCFLDGDTFPEPRYLETVRAAADDNTVLVGRRRHADFAGWGPERLRSWLGGATPGPPELPDPAWLREAYLRTRNLATAGDLGYRYVIAAVQSLSRRLLDRVGGWESAIDVYGGEDWELANRCWLAGAELRHLPDAVGWHDGPDAAGRGDLVRLKNLETTTLARYVTDPGVRGTGLIYDQPDVVVRFDDRGRAEADVALSVASLLRDTDARVWLRDGAARTPRGPLAEDPRVHLGRPGARVLGRCRYQVDVAAPVLLTGATLRALCEQAPVRSGPLTIRATRDLALDRATAVHRDLPLQALVGAQLEAVWSRA